MSKLHIATRGPGSWRDRLCDPAIQWKRGASAMETAVAWERAARQPHGLPRALLRVFKNSELGEAELLLAIAEHKVPLRGTGGDSQCDVWALVKTVIGNVSLTVEAKALESFGNGHEHLALWLKSGKSPGSPLNREKRWQHIQENLPAFNEDAYSQVAFQLLHRCAASVIEARRFGLNHAAFIVQAFGAPETSFTQFSRLCAALGLGAQRGRFLCTSVQDVELRIAWVDCSVATDAEMASTL